MTMAKTAEEITRTTGLRWNIITSLWSSRGILEQMYLHKNYVLGKDGLYHWDSTWEEWRPVLEVKNGVSFGELKE